ncbi:gliding motility lipoprotein GldH [Tenacibaculum amylolyticum]|uniref:gliding motility lipoprotein GldH n=1 Tax=Tenacibaculum amylolyticum TaxID=104269 RepID=UPI003895E4A2
MLKTIQKNSFLGILIMLVVVSSCDSKRVYDEYTSIKGGKWGINNPITYQFEVTDTLAKRNLFINIRNNNEYPYSNLFLITKMKFPDGQSVIDTLEYDMADETGKFLGKGYSELKENKLFYKEQILFPVTGTYQLEISQAMRKNGEIDGVTVLDGVTDVGFRIEKTK